MYRTIFLGTLFMLFCSVIPGKAQPPRDIDKVVTHLKDRLALTDEQVEKTRDILERNRTEMEKLRQLNEENRKATRNAMQDLRRETDDQIRGVLTDEQQAEFEKMRAERSQERPRRGPRDGRRPHNR